MYVRVRRARRQRKETAMKCQFCGSGDLNETKVSIPINTPRGRIVIGEVPAVKCMKCGKEFMSVVTQSRLKDIYKEWEESGEPGDKIIKYTLLNKHLS
jgi:YgiT-type zinc finger domain-containing protein